MTISAVVSQYFKRYCESSNSPVFGHIWIIVINAIAVTIAMYCLIQFYVQLKEQLAEHKLFLKIVAIKLVVFFLSGRHQPSLWAHRLSGLFILMRLSHILI
ncbi:hypothetical protein J3459_007778 [Metarhizium acridum]|nr:hypothetical protein J3459_007778 [Metarhizium acridum]